MDLIRPVNIISAQLKDNYITIHDCRSLSELQWLYLHFTNSMTQRYMIFWKHINRAIETPALQLQRLRSTSTSVQPEQGLQWQLDNFLDICNLQGPVVQSVVSLTSALRVISLTVLTDSIYNILIFFAEKMWVAFALQKLLTFFQQKISAYLRITWCKH